MSAITANTLFHFTKSEDVLQKILSNGFRPSYCTEFGEALENRVIEMQIPMVCFCDLPISKLDKHIGVYGRYGIGMSKEWGMKMNLNPVTYVHPNSFLLHATGQMLRSLTTMINEEKRAYFAFLEASSKGIKTSLNVETADEASIREFQRINDPGKRLAEVTFVLSSGYVSFAHMKPYRDKANDRLFYDEREWRYVVPYTSEFNSNIPYLIKRDGVDVPLFANQENLGKDKYKEIIEQTHMIPFDADEIKYIIVDSDKDVHRLITFLKSSSKYNPDQVDILTTKIITCEQIDQDF